MEMHVNSRDQSIEFRSDAPSLRYVIRDAEARRGSAGFAGRRTSLARSRLDVSTAHVTPGELCPKSSPKPQVADAIE